MDISAASAENNAGNEHPEEPPRDGVAGAVGDPGVHRLPVEFPGAGGLPRRGRVDADGQGLDLLPQPADLHGDLQRQAESLVGVAHHLAVEDGQRLAVVVAKEGLQAEFGDQAEDRVLGRADPLAAHLHRDAVAEEGADNDDIYIGHSDSH